MSYQRETSRQWVILSGTANDPMRALVVPVNRGTSIEIEAKDGHVAFAMCPQKADPLKWLESNEGHDRHYAVYADDERLFHNDAD